MLTDLCPLCRLELSSEVVRGSDGRMRIRLYEQGGTRHECPRPAIHPPICVCERCWREYAQPTMPKLATAYPATDRRPTPKKRTTPKENALSRASLGITGQR